MEERRKQAKAKEKEMAKLRAEADRFYIHFLRFTFLCQKNKEWRLRRESRINEAESENDSVSSGNEDLERALRLIFHTVHTFEATFDQARAGVSAVLRLDAASDIPV